MDFASRNSECGSPTALSTEVLKNEDEFPHKPSKSLNPNEGFRV